MNKYWNIKFAGVNLLRTIPKHVRRRLWPHSKPIHVLFCMVDHFEPGTGNVPVEIEKQRMRELLDKYPILCEKHKDSYGNPPKRTWFFPPHYHRNNNLKELVGLCRAGYGEIELHLHHGKIKPDTPENLEKTIKQCVEEYSKFGIFGMENGKKKYGFIHGNSALDNSRGCQLCGVNNEIDILIQTGCYADFTFPCVGEPNPRKINSIYYAIDDPNKPKSYDTGQEVIANWGNAAKGLMMIQGPLFPYFKKNNFWGLRLYSPVVDGYPPVDDRRVDAWIRSNICIKGCENWVIVKTHTHGAVESRAVLGKEMEFIFEYLENKYNDGERYQLHYVSAREIYNVIKATEAGEPITSPDDYRDYLIKKPEYNGAINISNASDKLNNLVRKTYC